MSGTEFWDREVVAPQHVTWLEEPAIHDYALRLIGQGTAIWPVEWLSRWLRGRRFKRALSIGCGTGPLERGFIRLDLVESIDAFDGSMTSLHTARAEARREGMAERLRYFACDFNRPALPRGKYDLVLFHQSAHHVEKLERLFAQVLRALTPDGLLYMDEYVGPSRVDWNDDIIAVQSRFFATLPDDLKTHAKIPYPIQADDPSEAVRSSEIESRVQIGFDLLERRPYGGSLLALIYPILRRDHLTSADLEMLMTEEKKMLDAGLPSYYAVLVAKPKHGTAKTLALGRYAIAGKRHELQRIARSIRRRASWRRRG